MLSTTQLSRAVELVLWCVGQFGYADHTLYYDYRKNDLVMQPTGHDNGWYPQGYSSINFRNASDLMLFKLTFGNE
jgi:hypothetical protein